MEREVTTPAPPPAVGREDSHSVPTERDRDSSDSNYLYDDDEDFAALLGMSWVQGFFLRIMWFGLVLSLIGFGFFIGAWTSYLLDPRCSIPAWTNEEYIRLRNGTDMPLSNQ